MKKKCWIEQFKDRITRKEKIEESCILSAEEDAFFKLTESPNTSGTLDFAVTGYFLSLADCSNPEDPVRRQFMPTAMELNSLPYELGDPLGEAKYTITPRLIHRYSNRVLLLVTDLCAVYCRYCFRRHFTGKRKGIIGREELNAALSYIAGNKEVEEILLSGGDPLVIADSKIGEILNSIKKKVPHIVIRIGTRVPSVLPDRITADLINILKEYKPLWIIAQFNHPHELTCESIQALSRFIDAGIPVLNQSVLLRGINDNAETLAELSKALVAARVKPYYLFQGDLARGTSYFRVPLAEGFKIVRALAEKVSGIGMPVFAVDLPGGGGKVSLFKVKIEKSERGFCLIDKKGKKYFYPDEQK